MFTTNRPNERLNAYFVEAFKHVTLQSNGRKN